MSTLTLGDREVALNDEGFLVNSDDWTPELAEKLAESVGVTLTDDHWKALDFARADFTAQGTSPGLRRIAANAGVSMKDLYKLFPKGPGKLVARIAGVPKPKSCL